MSIDSIGCDETSNREATPPPSKEAGALEWLPIETAPKDGTPILIWQPDALGDWQHQSTYMPSDRLQKNECVYKANDPRQIFFDDWRYGIGYWRPRGGWGNRNSATVNPTHWMPLPAPPLPGASHD